MFKRPLWLLTGAAVGAGGSLWAQRRLKEAAARLTPSQVSDDAVHAARKLGRDLVDAVAEGRRAMREREAELYGQLADRAAARALPSGPARRFRALPTGDAALAREALPATARELGPTRAASAR